jgi:molybdate/tungstate transport system substrate-binding protein
MASLQVKKLPIFHAGSLTAVFGLLNVEFKKLHPDIEITSEPAGSVDAVLRITEQKRQCGVLASADYALIPRMMFPVYADWYIIFASDEMVISYTEKSKYHDEINENNWYEILSREGVTYSLQNPELDPGGYRTIMVWQLGEKYYGVPDLSKKLRESVGCKILPQTEPTDYNFTYRSGAVRNKARYLTLPEKINLSNGKFDSFYAQAKVEVKGKISENTIILNGESILFGLTVPKLFSDQHLAIEWVRLLLSEKGKTIMKNMGMKPLEPGLTNDIGKIPPVLRELIS